MSALAMISAALTGSKVPADSIAFKDKVREKRRKEKLAEPKEEPKHRQTKTTAWCAVCARD